jgi:magnesium chelatase subunit I
MNKLTDIKTFVELKNNGYKSISVKDEMRNNLIEKLKNKEETFKGIIGYEETVVPEIQTAILSRHNIILLGLRGQAKTRIARSMIDLLDEYVPIIAGSEINDDPFNPISRFGKDLLTKMGDETPIEWIRREDRYSEKLATPDVTIADLIGDVDPIKAASLKLHYSDDRVIHFGLVPRTNRSIFVINELPDLQAKIQVALFNLLQEKDVQIRGFKIRLPLDVQFVFTANPEDYTNRGSIVTPLKDRIDSQIMTHYPRTIKESREITAQETKLKDEQIERIVVADLAKDLVEQCAFQARESEYIDHKSGVSARLSISAYENLISTAERRRLLNSEDSTFIRISDFMGIIPSITGKIELVYEGEQEGPIKIAHIILGKAIKKIFSDFFPNPEEIKKKNLDNPYQEVTRWFSQGNKLDMLNNYSDEEYREKLNSVPGLKKIVDNNLKGIENNSVYIFMELVLHGLAENSLLSKFALESGIQFEDMLSSMFTMNDDDDDFTDEESYI